MVIVELNLMDAAIVYNLMVANGSHIDHARIANDIQRQMLAPDKDEEEKHGKRS